MLTKLPTLVEKYQKWSSHRVYRSVVIQNNRAEPIV